MPKTPFPARAHASGPWSGGGSVQFPANSQNQPFGCAVMLQPFSAYHSRPHLQPWLPGPSLGSRNIQDHQPVSLRLPGLSCTQPSLGPVSLGSGGAGPLIHLLRLHSSPLHPIFSTKTVVGWEKIAIISPSPESLEIFEPGTPCTARDPGVNPEGPLIAQADVITGTTPALSCWLLLPVSKDKCYYPLWLYLGKLRQKPVWLICQSHRVSATCRERETFAETQTYKIEAEHKRSDWKKSRKGECERVCVWESSTERHMTGPSRCHGISLHPGVSSEQHLPGSARTLEPVSRNRVFLTNRLAFNKQGKTFHSENASKASSR